MKRSILSAVMYAVMFYVSPVWAVLPPLWESVAEVKSLLEQPEIGTYLESADIINSITRTEGGFRIVTQRHILDAKIQYLPQEMPGPAKFSWTFQVQVIGSSS